MDLGRFSLSLAVQDLTASRAFYEALGFRLVNLDPVWSVQARECYGKTWWLLETGKTRLFLIQGVMERNTLTFHPPDVRGLQRKLKSNGVRFLIETDEDGTGGDYAVCVDPDGNPILFDQLT